MLIMFQFFFLPRRFIHSPLVPFSHQDLNTTKDIVGKSFEDLDPNLGVLLVQTLALNIFQLGQSLFSTSIFALNWSFSSMMLYMSYSATSARSSGSCVQILDLQQFYYCHFDPSIFASTLGMSPFQIVQIVLLNSF